MDQISGSTSTLINVLNQSIDKQKTARKNHIKAIDLGDIQKIQTTGRAGIKAEQEVSFNENTASKLLKHSKDMQDQVVESMK